MSKTLLPLVAALLLAAPAGAATYHYNGNMPMAKVMLDMMEVLGYVTRVPDPAPYGATGWGRSFAPWPLTGLWGLGATPLTGGLNPVTAGVPGLSALPGQQAMTGWTGSAAQGVLPRGTVPVDVNTLATLMNALQNRVGGAAPAPPPTTAGGSASVFPTQPGDTDTMGLPAAGGGTGQATLADLAGVWQGSNQDILTVVGNQFLWSNGRGQTVAGTLAVQGNRLVTHVPGVQTPVTYTYRLEGDRLEAFLANGQRYTFQRLKR